MTRSLLPLAMLVATVLVGCDASIKIDPEGYRCDVGNVCPTGFTCQTGVCQRGNMIDPSCANVSCNTPPAATCSSSTVARTFTGRCVAGACTYDPVDMTCPTTCDQGVCTDACQGVSCVTPPAAACTDAMTLRTFAQTGACSAGTCSYTPTDTACPNGCSAGRCMGVDLCVQNMVTCNTPPAVTCNGTSRRTFTTPGTCDPGTGMCTYQFADMACPNGCAQGMCLTPSLSFSQTGPRVKFAINALDVAPSSSGNSALAVGPGGKLARWDGSMWTEMTTNTTVNLNSVAFVTGTIAFAAGERTTLLNVRPTTNAVTPIALSGGGNINLVSVSGRSEAEVVVAGDEGSIWRARGGMWANSSLPSANGPYTITSAYLDESLRERVVGQCGALDDQCVAYRFASGGTPMWTVQTRVGSVPFAAVGGGFDIPATATTSVAFLGASMTLLAHDTTGFTTGTFFTTQSPSPALAGGSIVGISAQAAPLNRDVYVLTSSAGTATGHLYRLTRNLTTITSNDALTTFYGEEHLSPNDANGVLVAETRRTFGVNNVFRRGPITNEALDVGEDLIGASADGTGALYFASPFGDVAIRRPNATTFEFRRPTGDWSIAGLEARNGTGLLLVGEDGTSGDGLIIRLVGTTFTTLTTLPGQQFKSVCRVSDTEGWAVGTRGTIFRLNGTMATAVSSPTTNDLLSVDCAAGGVAVACGAGGTVLRLNGGNWSSVTPSFPGTGVVETCKLTPNGGIVGGDGFLYFFGMGGWTMLPGKAGLNSIVLRAAGEMYGSYSTATGTSDIARFDGAAWGPSLLSIKGELGTGVLIGGRVVWGGSLGAIVESR